MRRILIAPLIAGLLLTMTACGSKEETSTATEAPSAKSSDSDQSTTTEKQTATTEDDASDEDDSGTSGMPDLPTGLNDDCLAVGTLYAGAMAQAAAVFNPSGVSTEDLDKLKDEFEKAKDSVPDEIADAFDTWATAWTEYMTALDGLGEGGMVNPANLDKLEKATEIIEAPDVKAASDEIDAYLEEKCG